MSVILFVFQQFDFMFLCQGNGLFVTGYLIEVNAAVFLDGQPAGMYDMGDLLSAG